MPAKILVVFEGRKTEPGYFEVLSKSYLSDPGDHLICAFENCIYDLWTIMNSDPDLDIVEVIRERSEKNKSILSGFSRSDISQVYLFFDFDGHDGKYSPQKVNELTSFFSNETENGAIFISYPMVESLRHFSKNFNFYEKKVKALKNIRYKNLVHVESDPDYSNVRKVDIIKLNSLLRHHIIKANFICGNIHVTGGDECFFAGEIKYVEQSSIFAAQLEKFIKIDSEVSILSAFPLFLHQYFGDGIFVKLTDVCE